MYLTENELTESVAQDVFLLNNLKKNTTYSLKEFADNYPGFIHFNQCCDYSLIYANRRSEEYFDLSTEEIREMDSEFIHRFFYPETWNRNIPELLQYANSRDRKVNALGQFQKVRKRRDADFETFITITTVSEQFGCLISFEYPSRIFGDMALKMNKLLDDNLFLRKNFRKFSLLTNRELEIIKLIGRGNSRSKIAEDLKISKHTFDNHRKHIRQKLEIKNSAELFQYIKAFDLV